MFTGRWKALWTCVLASVVGFSALVLGQEAPQPDQARYAWRMKMESVVGRYKRSDMEKVLGLYDEALALAPDDECKADTLYHLALRYESWREREDTIATYKRIVSEYPDSGHVPRVLRRLGALYRNTTLIPADASEERSTQVMSEMTNENCMPFFEAAVKAGSNQDRDVLSSKMALSNIYSELGRAEDSKQLLYELAALEDDAINPVRYVGPFDQMRHLDVRPEDEDYERWVEQARKDAADMRQSAGSILVRRAVVRNDPGQSINNLEELVSLFPDKEVADMAREAIKKIADDLMEKVEPPPDASGGETTDPVE
jgi:tetratricopeptide (TPR) repeat protein